MAGIDSTYLDTIDYSWGLKLGPTAHAHQLARSCQLLVVKNNMSLSLLTTYRATFRAIHLITVTEWFINNRVNGQAYNA